MPSMAFILFMVYYKHSEYGVQKAETLKKGLLKFLSIDGGTVEADPMDEEDPNNEFAKMSDAALLEYTMDLGQRNWEDQTGWKLVAVIEGGRLLAEATNY